MENIAGSNVMQISVASYLKGIPSKNVNPQKTAIIMNFIKGVNTLGDIGNVITNYDISNVDVAVVQGFVHPNSRNSSHLTLRKNVFESQQQRGKRSIIVDSNLFLYADPVNTKTFLRYSYDGIFPNTGEYCNDTPNPERWDILSRALGISLKPWKNGGRNILICCQRNGGWSMNGKELLPWLINTIDQIKKYSDKQIVVRFHPGDKRTKEHKIELQKHRLRNVVISNTESILQEFTHAHCIVNYNSSPAVAAAIEGVPAIVLDPVRSQAADVSHHSLDNIENLQEFDREVWAFKMAQMHWTLDELNNGTAWKHLRKWAIK